MDSGESKRFDTDGWRTEENIKANSVFLKGGSEAKQSNARGPDPCRAPAISVGTAGLAAPAFLSASPAAFSVLREHAGSSRSFKRHTGCAIHSTLWSPISRDRQGHLELLYKEPWFHHSPLVLQFRKRKSNNQKDTLARITDPISTDLPCQIAAFQPEA